MENKIPYPSGSGVCRGCDKPCSDCMCKNTPDVFKFNMAFDTGEFIPENIGRFQLSDGQILRVIFTPRGLEVIAPKDSKSIHFVDNDFGDQVVFIPDREK